MTVIVISRRLLAEHVDGAHAGGGGGGEDGADGELDGPLAGGGEALRGGEPEPQHREAEGEEHPCRARRAVFIISYHYSLYYVL